MALTDNKIFGGNIGIWQLVGLVALAALVFLAIATDSLVIGYVVMTLALCAFFIIVAFDIGAPRRDRPSPTDEGQAR